MPKSSQYITYALPSQTGSLGAQNQQITVPLSDLPKAWNGRIAHLESLHYRVTLTPTFTTAPTQVGMNSVFKSCDVFDGSFGRFVGGFNILRALERLHTGRLRFPDPDTNTPSGSARYFHRVWYAGPPNFEGAPTDFVIPSGMLTNGEIRILTGALTDISADCTACTYAVNIVARLYLADEVRIPPAYQVMSQSVTGNDISIQGRALFETLALFDSLSFGNWSAGDLGSVTLEMGQGPIVNNTPDAVLTGMYQADFAPGELGTFGGPPGGATDDNGKVVDHSGPTALAAAPNDIQPILWSGPNHRLSKLFLAESSAHLTWTGTQGTALALFARILPQNQNVTQQNAGRALAKLDGKRPQGGGPKTLSKKPYQGPYGEFMPWNVKV